MSRLVIVVGLCMLVATVTVYLVDVLGYLAPLLAGVGAIGVGGLLLVLGSSSRSEPTG